MTTVETIINNYQKQNQLKPQNHNHELSPSDSSSSDSDSSSSTSLSNSNNPSKKSNSNINIINQIYPASLISTSVLDWNETQVNQFFSSLGLNRFENEIRGDVLIHLDNELLKDIGIQSVGNRLAILRAIYKLKLNQDIPIEDGHWVPPLGDIDHLDSEDPSSPYSCSSTPPNQSIDRLIEIRDQRINHLETEIRSIKSDLQNFAARLNSSSASSLLTSSNPTSPSIFESQLASSNPRYGRHLREQSINQLVIPDNQSIPRTFSPINTIHSIEEPIIKTSTVSSPTSTSSATTTPHETSFVSDQTTSTPTLKDSSRTTTKSSTTASNLSKDDDQSNPCKSFKVTLEDPCYKVLPAALKKYKIKEHYKNYVLFICYGNQERCLSYEDKPLLLFQKLKEAHQNPVFTLRHIKDIESPISIALNKQNQRREKAKVGGNQDSTVNSISKKGPPKLGSVEDATGFCISIYPYMSEVGEGFDVGVGDTFLIIGKSKGWWVVIRDYGAASAKDREGTKSSLKRGFIPSGCLIETTKSFASNEGNGKVSYLTMIEPEEIKSVSSSCLGLMDYKAKNTDELSLEYGDHLKVYKKYNNWSFAINESRGTKNRGWAPSWLIGNRKDLKLSNSSSNNTSKNNNVKINVSNTGSVSNGSNGNGNLSCENEKKIGSVGVLGGIE
ncbi:expressed protein [Phakopsora pachyrhizi]|uniref:Expressed protein n=1 Tax=Phakopsora pachyrhizi TaxID=170000 RepID=A0AAV0AHA0_PHAPC|nr:expressed protein [Phakopsora pachyrhizi]